MSAETAMIVALVTPLVGAALVVLLGRAPNLRETASLLAGAVTFAAVLRVAAAVRAGESIALTLFEPTPGLRFAFDVEPLGLVFALVASLLWPVTTLYAIGYMRGHHERNQTRFFCFFAISISAVLALAFSANFATLFVCYEVITLATFPLVTHANDRNAWRAGRIYIGVLMGTSIGLLLFAVLAVHSIAGTTDFTPGGSWRGRWRTARSARRPSGSSSRSSSSAPARPRSCPCIDGCPTRWWRRRPSARCSTPSRS